MELGHLRVLPARADTSAELLLERGLRPLELRLELLPAVNAEDRVGEAALLAQLKREREIEVSAERRFFAAAKEWWETYLEARPAHRKRVVHYMRRLHARKRANDARRAWCRSLAGGLGAELSVVGAGRLGWLTEGNGGVPATRARARSHAQACALIQAREGRHARARMRGYCKQTRKRKCRPCLNPGRNNRVQPHRDTDSESTSCPEPWQYGHQQQEP